MKVRTDFEMKIDVAFSDPELAKSFWVDGDFKETMWDIADLDELASMIASAFHGESRHYDETLKKFVKEIEGYGTFVPDEHNNVYTANYDHFDGLKGLEIKVSYEDTLEPTGSYLVSGE